MLRGVYPEREEIATPEPALSVVRFFAEFTLSEVRFFASLRMTGSERAQNDR